MTVKVLVLCPPSAINLGEVVKNISGDVEFEMPDLVPAEDNLELYFIKICMSLSKYDRILVLVTEDLFQLEYVNKIIRAMIDLNMGVFIPIGNSYNYPDWFPKHILNYPPSPVFSSSDLWTQLFPN